MLPTALAALAVAQFSDALPITISLVSHEAVHAADVDGDGSPDIVVATREPETVSLAWLRRLPSGAFGELRPIEVGDPEIRSIDSADFDGDGVLDLVVVDRESRVSFLRGLGGGAFDAAVEIGRLNNVGFDVRIADVDGDGDPDVLVPTRSLFADQEALILNLGGGAFAPQVPIADRPVNGLAPFDADGDGDLDLVAYRDNEILTLRNDGPAGFVEVGIVDAIGRGEWLRLADLDGDGLRDIVLVQRTPLPILTYRGTGGFGFQASGSIVDQASVSRGVAVLDVDRDGREDLVLAPPAGLGVQWLAGTPAGTLAASAALTPGQPSRAADLATADFDGDGGLDLVLARREASIAVLDSDLNATGPAFDTTLREITGRLADVDDVVALDVDGDGDRDVLGASLAAGLALARSRAAEGFEAPVPILPAIDGARNVVRADVDGDGAEDVVLEDRAGVLYALWNDVGTDLVPAVLDGASLDLANEAAFGDLEGDGDVDLFVPLVTGEVAVYEQTAPRTFAPRRIAADSPETITEVVAIDADVDGDLDLVVLEDRLLPFGQVRSSIRLFEGGPGGAFTDAGILAPTQAISVDLRVLQLTANTRPSFVWAATNENAIDVARPAPNGGWDRLPSRLPVAGPPQRVAVADLDGAGSPDVVVRAPGAASTIEVIHVSDTGSFTSRTTISDGSPFDADLEVVDLDGDFDADVVSLDAPLGRMVWHRNDAFGDVGTTYCGPAVLNSTGVAARLLGAGSDEIARNELRLLARDVPVGSTGLFLVANASGLVPMAGGSAGTLCLGGAIGRYVGPGAVQPANDDGLLTLDVDLTSFPSPTGPVTPLPGTLWYFQAWYRDAVGGVPTSNFTNGLAVAVR
ncbi:MAG: VCBS repeat-containing protein [Planctomycetota bacterium]